MMGYKLIQPFLTLQPVKNNLAIGPQMNHGWGYFDGVYDEVT